MCVEYWNRNRDLDTDHARSRRIEFVIRSNARIAVSVGNFQPQSPFGFGHGHSTRLEIRSVPLGDSQKTAGVQWLSRHRQLRRYLILLVNHAQRTIQLRRSDDQGLAHSLVLSHVVVDLGPDDDLVGRL